MNKHLEKLRARLKELTDALAAIEAKDTLSAEDIEAVTKHTAEVEEVEKQIETLEKAEAARARAAKPANQPVSDDAAPAAPAQKLKTSEKIGLAIAAMAKAHVEGEGNGRKAAFKQLDDAGFGEVAREFELAAKKRALNSAGAAAGGILVPENMANEIIDILRPATTFLQGMPRRVPMVGGVYKVPAAASGASAGWRGEGKAISASEPTFKDINMSSKFLDSLVPLTNQLIRFSLPDVRGWVEMDMAQAMGTELDRAAYLGTGTVHQPLGISKIPGVTRNAAQGAATPTVAQIEDDAATAELAMMNVNLPMLGAAWVMSPRTFIFLQNQRDGNGNRYYPELQLASPRWRNKPVLVTTQIPVNGGDTTDETEIMLVAFGHVFYGEGMGITFAVSNEASYTAGATTVSAFQNDLTLIKASMEADVDLRYLQAVSVITACRWGA